MLDRLELDELTPSKLWSELDPATRKLAAEAVYDRESDDESSRVEADVAIAGALRFRVVAVRKLPTSKRIDYLIRAVRPDDGLASTLLRCLHLTRRRELLGAFLDELGVPHDNGLIDSDTELDTSDGDRIEAAIENLRRRFERSEVDLYLATLLALDPEQWEVLGELVRRELEAGAAG